MSRFEKWLWRGSNTAHNEVFGVGVSVKLKDRFFTLPREDCFRMRRKGRVYLRKWFVNASIPDLIGKNDVDKIDDQTTEIIHNTSKCTYQHPKCQMACGILFSVIISLSKGDNLQAAIKEGVYNALKYYRRKPKFTAAYNEFAFLLNIDQWNEDEIKSSAYVVDTLQASLWCLYMSASYSECVLKAVNLGENTDTIGALFGAVAGMWFGEGVIPAEWQEVTGEVL